jgi:hypothetical protein
MKLFVHMSLIISDEVNVSVCSMKPRYLDAYGKTLNSFAYVDGFSPSTSNHKQVQYIAFCGRQADS